MGEFLNFVGAFILALDIFRRPKLRRQAGKLQQLRDFGREFSLETITYKGVDICSARFEEIIADRYSTALGATGVAIMGLGFLCLMAYHWIEMCI